MFDWNCTGDLTSGFESAAKLLGFEPDTVFLYRTPGHSIHL
ncbi:MULTISPECIES: hypothetical protein [Paenibacillus]|nr:MULTISPECIES: hypothetical protein [Paenibacillus]